MLARRTAGRLLFGRGSTRRRYWADHVARRETVSQPDDQRRASWRGLRFYCFVNESRKPSSVRLMFLSVMEPVLRAPALDRNVIVEPWIENAPVSDIVLMFA